MKRNAWFDTISGLFILLIVIQHILQNCGIYDGYFFERYLVRAFPAFMPWFFYKSGLFFRYNISGFARSQVKKLLYPFFIWSLIPSLLVLPFYILNSGMYDFFINILRSLYYAHGVFNAPLWFLPSLLISSLTVYYLAKVKIRLGGGVLLIALLLSYIIYYFNFQLPLGISYMFLGVYFYALGVRCQTLTIKFRWSLLLIISYVAILFALPSMVNFHRNQLTYGNYIVYIVLCTLFLLVVKSLNKYNLEEKFLSYIGRNSMCFYVSHAPVIVLTDHILDAFDLSIDCYVKMITESILILFVCVVICKYKSKIQPLFVYKKNKTL